MTLTKEQLEAVAERAYAEATHPSEIEARAMCYAYAMLIGIGVGPAPKITPPSDTDGEAQK